jgi:hypothetical protein
METMSHLVQSHEEDTHRQPWDGILASAGPRDHIVQLYQDQEFLNRAVCRFVRHPHDARRTRLLSHGTAYG